MFEACGKAPSYSVLMLVLLLMLMLVLILQGMLEVYQSAVGRLPPILCLC